MVLSEDVEDQVEESRTPIGFAKGDFRVRVRQRGEHGLRSLLRSMIGQNWTT